MKFSGAGIVLWSLLAAFACANGESRDTGGLIGSDDPAGKRYVYKHSGGDPREIEVFFPPNHDPAKSRAPGLILFHGGNWEIGRAHV